MRRQFTNIDMSPIQNNKLDYTVDSMFYQRSVALVCEDLATAPKNNLYWYEV